MVKPAKTKDNDQKIIAAPFVYTSDSKKTLNKLKKGERVNIFFPITYYNANYYYLYQGSAAANLLKNRNIHLYIALVDNAMFVPTHENFVQSKKFKDELLLENNMNELRIILESLGVKREQIHLYRFSKILSKFMGYNKQNVIDFFSALAEFPSDKMTIDEEITSRWYIPKGSHYSTVYGVQKVVDLFASSNFHKLFPMEIQGKIDLLIVSPFSYPLLSEIKKIMQKKNLLENVPETISFQKIPTFGHTRTIDTKFRIPHIHTPYLQILEIINNYQVKEEHLDELMERMFFLFAKKFYALDSKNEFVEVKKTPDLKRIDFEKKKKVVAYNMSKFFESVKEGIDAVKKREGVSILMEDEILDTARILKSKTALKIMMLGDGTYTVSEMARKLNKHTSNISALISKMKKHGLVFVTYNGKIKRSVKEIKLSFG